MASIRSVEGRSGALQAASAKRLKADAYKKTYDSAKAQMGGSAPYVPATAQTYAKTVAANPQFAKTVNKDIQQDAKAIAYKNTYDSAKAQMGGASPYQSSTPAQAAAGSTRKAVTVSGGAPTSTSTSGGSTYKAPTPGSGSTSTSTSTTSTKTADAPKAAAPAPTTSVGTAPTISTGPSATNSGGRGRSAMRGNRKSKRDNPRAARSTSIDELKKQAARSLGI